MTQGVWAAVIEGDEFDLGVWNANLKDGFDPWIEMRQGEPLLRSRQFNSVSSAAHAREVATLLIDQLNGTLSALAATLPIELSAIANINETDHSQRRYLPALSRTGTDLASLVLT